MDEKLKAKVLALVAQIEEFGDDSGYVREGDMEEDCRELCKLVKQLLGDGH